MAQTLSYTQTAENLFTSQGNVSKQILALKKELDLKLFDRQHRHIVLSPAGAKLLPQAQAILAAYEGFDAAAQAYKQEHTRSISLYGLPTMSHYGIMAKIGAFHQLRPDIHFRLEEEEGELLDQALDKHDAHFIFNRYFNQAPDANHLVLEEDQMVVVLPENHHLAQEELISLGDLAGETFLQLGKTSSLYEELLALCQAAGFSPHFGYRGKRVSFILEMVSQGLGVSVVMQKTLTKRLPGNLVIKPLKESQASQMCLVKGPGPLPKEAQDFWDYVQANAPIGQ